MELSIRRKFGEEHGYNSIQVFTGSLSWDQYLAWIKLKCLDEVRSYDFILNPIDRSVTVEIFSVGEIISQFSSLEVTHPYQYLQLAINTAEEDVPLLPDWVKLLGYDLVENGFAISSLLNCGPWKGELAQFTAQLNKFGLLGIEEVKRAEVLLPTVWGQDEPHAFADVWAICEVSANNPDHSYIPNNEATSLGSASM